ncbi:lycopene cyclase domain-containing protein [Microbacterium sp. JZ31]|uniref:lycopene cyclase domain-containing protein n=1 Tax=Microbacterium sp. JZ31 TaxID=1906274 RepID=UPI00193277C7|nr:lycopene cyclase domain-containing protein [Microbacterium sp. JZ31]
MTYLGLCAAFLAVAVVAAVLLRRGGRASAGAAGAPERISLAALALAAAALIALTAVFDNVMIAAGLFAYDDAHISGIRIGAAPAEDFAYPLAAVILLPAVWARLIAARERRSRRDP